MGINVGWSPDGAGRLGAGVEPLQLLAALLDAFDRLPVSAHELVSATGRAGHARAARARRAARPATLVGTAIDVASTAASSWSTTAGMSHRLDVGDVVHLRVT